MQTDAAARALVGPFDDVRATVRSLRQLQTEGWTRSAIRAQVAARRWQRIGKAIVLHNGAPREAERRRIVLITSAPHAVLTSFSAATELGLTGWERPAVHVLVPGGTHVTRVPGLATRVHYSASWDDAEFLEARQLHRAAPALLIAAAGFASARPACGILAAGVQQRIVTTAQLELAVTGALRLRHRHALTLALADIGQGSQALSEIDLVALCRRHGLPVPTRQGVRVEPSGRRRYLDAEWRLRGGRRLVVEVDGAIHLSPRRWWDDQLRQNELVIAGDVVLRYPSVIVRAEAAVVAEQLARALR